MKLAASGHEESEFPRADYAHRLYAPQSVFSTGYFTIGRFQGVPIRIHWTAAVGAFIFGRLQIVPGFWLGFLTLIMVHEMGHAFLVRVRRLRALEIMIHGFGGHCRHEAGSAYDRAIIAWGGVLAQMIVLYVPAVLLISFGLWPSSRFMIDFAYAMTEINLVIALFNLAPFPPFDGHMAWRLPGMWMERRRVTKKGKAWKGKAVRAKRENKARPVSNESPEELARRIAQEALDKARKGID